MYIYKKKVIIKEVHTLFLVLHTYKCYERRNGMTKWEMTKGNTYIKEKRRNNIDGERHERIL